MKPVLQAAVVAILWLASIPASAQSYSQSYQDLRQYMSNWAYEYSADPATSVNTVISGADAIDVIEDWRGTSIWTGSELGEKMYYSLGLTNAKALYVEISGAPKAVFLPMPNGLGLNGEIIVIELIASSCTVPLLDAFGRGPVNGEWCMCIPHCSYNCNGCNSVVQGQLDTWMVSLRNDDDTWQADADVSQQIPLWYGYGE